MITALSPISPAALAAALRERRFETARRIGLALLKSYPQPGPEILLPLHDALRGLGDLRGAIDLVTAPGHALAIQPSIAASLLADDYRRLSALDHYRISEEAQAGLTSDEYRTKYLTLSRQYAERVAERSPLPPDEKSSIRQLSAPPDKHIRLTGRILDESGAAISGATVTVGRIPPPGLPVIPREVSEVEFSFRIPKPATETAITDSEGHFVLSLPTGHHAFLAITNPQWDIITRFLLRALDLADDTNLGTLTIADWKSAPPSPRTSPHSDTWNGGRKLAETCIANPFDYDFPRQLLRLPLPEGAHPVRPRVVVRSGSSETVQVSDGEILLMLALPAGHTVWIAIYEGEGDAPVSVLRLAKGEYWEIHSGTASFRISAGGGAPPIDAIRGPDGVWRGAGRFRLPAGLTVTAQSTTLLDQGPVRIMVRVETTFSDGYRWTMDLTALAGEPALLVHETSQPCPDAAFEFSLREFSGGRGFLHWTPEHGNRHWTTLAAEDRVVARLPESVPWWISPQGFGCAFTSDGLEDRDYIAVFSIRRGEWIDREFARLCRGPIGEDGQPDAELDWPYPEMVGSSISWITAQTTSDGDACFRFDAFDGERHWGLLASSLLENDGDEKKLASVQHANSSPRLQDFKDWHPDECDSHDRPLHLAQRSGLFQLRRKTQAASFRGLWQKIRTGSIPGAAEGLAFALDGDPAIAWRRREQLLIAARLRARTTLLGRDRGDLYSPVGGRPITQDAEDYDLLAASGVFSPDEEREVRSYLILMGHMFMERDLMNWNFQSRNANFEADRVEIVGTIGLTFPDHPDSQKFLTHAIDRTRAALVIYCTPGSGKWYENPACYYLHASKCRMALVHHLAARGHLDLGDIPRLKEFLRWGIILLTPPQPVDYEVMRSGDEATFAAAAKVRKVAPIGDHASLGAWLPEHYAFIGKTFLAQGDAFGRELMEAYFLSNGDALALRDSDTDFPPDETSPFGNLPLLFTALEEADIPSRPAVHLASRRLEGFGAVIRDNSGGPDETFLLIKQGPGGYRYHRTEGSFQFFAKGRPLIYEGGEGGETWRHSTLSFHESHMPLSAGMVEHFLDDPGFQFCQGRHPEIIQPGAPVFLSDHCDHRLVAECHRRRRISHPAASRSFVWVGGRYLVVHDEVFAKVPWHWHLQVVADSNSGSVKEGLHFSGRFGLDLDVQFPGQNFAETRFEQLPFLENRRAPSESFSTRHLQLSGASEPVCLAVLTPASDDTAPPTTRALRESGRLIGVRVGSSTTSDHLWLSRNGCAWAKDDIEFHGHYGACLESESTTTLVLMGTGRIRRGDVELLSDGPSARLRLKGSRVYLQAEGHGTLTVRHQGRVVTIHSAGRGEWDLA